VVFWQEFYTLNFEKVWEGTSQNGRTAGILHLINYAISLNNKWLSGRIFALLDFAKVWEGTSRNGRTAGILHLINYAISSHELSTKAWL
jgi:hypothetical protein